MPSANTFADARISLAGRIGGVDERGHSMFMVERTRGPTLFREYFEISGEINENDFNIEIGVFGFTDLEDAGNPYPSARQHFSAEEGLAAHKLIQDFFSTPSVVMKTWQRTPGVRFLGGVSFRPDWILQSDPKC
jgi:hypothetical protein